jgi:hypothetical protein
MGFFFGDLTYTYTYLTLTLRHFQFSGINFLYVLRRAWLTYILLTITLRVISLRLSFLGFTRLHIFTLGTFFYRV